MGKKWVNKITKGQEKRGEVLADHQKYDKSANYPNTNTYKRDISSILHKSQRQKLRSGCAT